MTPRTSLLFILFFSCTSLLTTVLSEMKPLEYFPVPYKENCAFPFSYQGQNHTDCITDINNGHIPWCSMTSDYKGLITYCFDFRKTTLQCSDTYKVNGKEYSGCNIISRTSPYKQCGTNETVKYRYCTDALDSPTLPSMINRDKCDPVYKNLSMDHTMCFGPSPYGFVVPFTDEERDEILSVHNDYRSRVSSRYMFKLYWDIELAKLAQAHTNLCAFEHDLAVNRMSPKFNWKNGQNIAMSLEIRSSPASLIESMLFDEEQNFHYGKNCAPGDNTCLHYTQAMISNLTRVGCGQTHCVYPDRIERLVTCNYIQSQYEDNYRIPYVQSDVPAIDCPLHADNGLCDCGDMICEFDKGQYIDPATCTCKSSSPQRSGRSVDLHEEHMAIKNGNLPGFSKRNLRKRSNK